MRSIFVGVGGFIGRIDSESRVAFWAQDPSEHKFDASRLISVDLSLTPKAAAMRQTSWDAVQVDDCFVLANGSIAGTTIGPRWPELRLNGDVYLEESYWQKVPTIARPSSMQDAGREYEFRTVVYWSHLDDARAGRRYFGHHAEILQEQGTLARVALYAPGTSNRPNARPMTLWIDLSAADQCDAGKDSLTEIGVGKARRRARCTSLQTRLCRRSTKGWRICRTAGHTLSHSAAIACQTGKSHPGSVAIRTAIRCRIRRRSLPDRNPTLARLVIVGARVDQRDRPRGGWRAPPGS